jgi:hypothetical protein
MIAHKRRWKVCRGINLKGARIAGIQPNGAIIGLIAHRKVMAVHMLAHGNGNARAPDHLAIADHRITNRMGLARDFVTLRDTIDGAEAESLKAHSRTDVFGRHCHAIIGIEQECSAVTTGRGITVLGHARKTSSNGPMTPRA